MRRKINAESLKDDIDNPPPIRLECAVCKLAKRSIETWTEVKTKKGKVRISSLHGKQEKQENKEIAVYFAEKYGHEIDLIAHQNDRKTADVYNRTLECEQEYVRNKTATLSAIDNALRKSQYQAADIVIEIKSEISDGDLRNAIQSRVRRSKNIQRITIIRDGNDKSYLKSDIVKSDWKL